MLELTRINAESVMMVTSHRILWRRNLRILLTTALPGIVGGDDGELNRTNAV